MALCLPFDCFLVKRNFFLVLGFLLFQQWAVGQCDPNQVFLSDVPSNFEPVRNPNLNNAYCVSFTVVPAATGHPIGFTMNLEHTFVGDLSIRAVSCGNTLMLLTRPGNANCAGGGPVGSGNDLNGVYTFSDGGGPDPDVALTLGNTNGGDFGLSNDRCNANSAGISSFADLGAACGNAPYTIQLCIIDHMSSDQGVAFNVVPIYANMAVPRCGCTDPAAMNYDPMANIEDGSCVYPPGCGGNFTDSGGSSDSYSNNENTTTTICPDFPGEVVTVTFNSFSTENSFDYLFVFDGPNTSSPQINSSNMGGRCGFTRGFSGTTIPGPFTSTHPSGCLTFVFCSDGSVVRPGWLADVSCTTACVPPDPPLAFDVIIPAGTQASIDAFNCFGTLVWYNQPTGGSPIDLGSPYITPILNNDQTYYVACDEGAGCESVRTPVTVFIETCAADAGTVALFGAVFCPGESISVGANFNQIDPAYVQRFILADPNNNILEINDTGDFSLPNACGTYTVSSYNYLDGGGSPTNPSNLNQISCQPTNCCDLATRTLSVSATVSMPSDESETVDCIFDVYTPTPPDLTDDCGSPLTRTGPQITGDPSCGGQEIYTWTYTDDCNGDTYEWSYTFQLAAPSVLMPADGSATISCAAEITDPILPDIVDNCGELLNLQGFSTSGQSCDGDFVLLYVFVDCAGNPYPWRFIYTVAAPTVTLPDAGSATVDCASEATAPTPPLIIDDCGENLTLFDVYEEPNPICGGNKTFIFTYEDCSGFFHEWYFVYTIAPPNVNMPADGSATVNCLDEISTFTPPTIMDNCGNALLIVSSNEDADPVCEGDKTYTFTYQDCVGFLYDWSYTFTLTPPEVIINCPANQEICEDAGIYSFPAATAENNCSQAVGLSYVITGATSRSGMGGDASGTFAPGLSTITWTTTNSCGLLVSCSTDVFIEPSPTITIGNLSCAADLSTYDVAYTVEDATVMADAGAVLPGVVAGIPAGQTVTLTVISNSGLGCTNEYVVNPPDCNCLFLAPPVVNPAEQTICEGDAIPTFTATVPAGLQVNWFSSPNGGDPILLNREDFAPAAAGTYYAETFDPETNCVSNTRTPITLIIIEVFGATFEEIDPVCAGTTFSLPSMSTNGISGTWSPAINTMATTTYTFTPDATAHPCEPTVALTVVVDEQPSLSIDGLPCAPDLLTYSVVYTASGGMVSSTAGTVTPTAIIDIPTGQAITITVTNPANGECSVSQAITAPDCSCPVIAPPVIDPAERTICEGETMPTFTATVPLGMQVNWYGSQSGGDPILLNREDFAPALAGTYYAEAFDPVNNCVSSTRTPITLIIIEVFGATFEEIDPVCAGTTFSLPSMSTNGISGTWSPAINTMATTTYTFTPDATAHPCEPTVALTVVVDEQPSLSIDGLPCAPDLLTYSVVYTASGGMVSSTAGTVTPTAIIDIPTGQAITITVTNPANGECSVSQAITAPDCSCPVIAPPVIDPAERTICEGETMPTFTATVPLGMQVNWYGSQSGGDPILLNREDFAPALAGTYYAEAFDPVNNCVSSRVAIELNINPLPNPSIDATATLLCKGDQSTLTAIGGESYLWNTGATTSSITVAPDSSTAYSVVANTLGCEADTGIGINVVPLPEATVTPSAICLGETATITASGGSTYAWSTQESGTSISVAPTTSSSYTVTVTEGNCSSTTTANVVVYPLPLPQITASSEAICTGSQVVLTASGGALYRWEDGTIGSSLIRSPAATTIYSVEASSAEGCLAATSIEIVVEELPEFNLSALNIGCEGADRGIILLDSVLGGTAPYLYAIDNGTFRPLGGIPGQLAGGLSQGLYTIRLQDAEGCTNSIQVGVPAAEELRIDLGEDRTINFGDSILLFPQASFEISRAIWLPPNGLAQPDSTFTMASPENSTTYLLRAFDANGCSAQDRINIRVERPSNVFIPTAFSPNGDGSNDIFLIYADESVVGINSFQIYNRWGEEVFYNRDFLPNDPEQGWDGKHRGELMNPAVFVYFTEVTYRDGRKEILKGEVVLVR